MKYVLCAIALLSLTACCGCPKGGMMNHSIPTASATMGAEQNNSSCYIATVKGMKCEACSMIITKNLMKNPAVKNVMVDVVKGSVTIQTNPDATLTEAEVKKVLERSNYTLTSFKQKCQ